MKKLFVLVALLCATTSVVFASDSVPVMKRSLGSFFVQQEAPVATGVSIEKTLVGILSSEQIDRIIHGESIPLNKTTKLVGWDISHTHLMCEDTTKQEAVLVGSVIRPVDKTTVTPRLVLNWFFVAAMLYLVLLWMAYLQRRVYAVILTYAAFAAGSAAFAAAASASIFATSAVIIAAATIVVAIIAVVAIIVAIDSKVVIRQVATIAGSVAMIVAMIFMWFI